LNAHPVGDSNRDGNDGNDRLPGVRRNSSIGPDYSTTDLRLTQRLKATERWSLNLLVESFNVFNRGTTSGWMWGTMDSSQRQCLGAAANPGFA